MQPLQTIADNDLAYLLSGFSFGESCRSTGITKEVDYSGTGVLFVELARNAQMSARQ